MNSQMKDWEETVTGYARERTDIPQNIKRFWNVTRKRQPSRKVVKNRDSKSQKWECDSQKYIEHTQV